MNIFDEGNLDHARCMDDLFEVTQIGSKRRCGLFATIKQYKP